MNLSELFIRRPVATLILMIGLIIFGALSYVSLPISDLPNVDFPTIQVSASLPGASPETMAASVATPLERQFTTIAGLDSMTSTSTLGSTNITLQFNLDRDIDAAAQDVQTAISRASRVLPQDMPSPPSYNKVNPADQPILFLALTSPSLPPSTLDEYGQTLMAQRISTVAGVAQVSVYGSQKYAVRVQLDPRELISRGLGVDEVAQAVQSANVNLPTGTLYGPNKAFTIESDAQLYNADQYRPLIVAYRNGQPVRLNQLGRVIDDVENNKTAAWFVNEEMFQRSVVLAVQKQPGTNTVEIADSVRSLIPSFQQVLPPAAQLVVLNDRSLSIRESIHDVKFTLILTIALVILVIFLFLRNVWATVIPSLAVPLSIIGTFAVMYALGFSLNNLSLMALTLSVGFVVDDAIVMLENIVRHLEEGESPLEASIRGSREIGFTIISMTISLAAVFIPVLFMGGVVGRLFYEFAMTITVAILISGVVSLTLTPMLCRYLLRSSGHTATNSRLYQISERVFDKGLEWYDHSLRWLFRNRRLTLLVSAFTLILTVYLFRQIPKSFLPLEDQGQIFGQLEAQQGISFASMVEKQREVAEIVRSHPAVRQFFSSVGPRGGSGATNTGTIFIRLRDRNERDQHAEEVIQDLRKSLNGVAGVRAFFQVPPPIRLGGQLTRAPYQLTLQGIDTNALYEAAPRLEGELRKLDSINDVTSDLELRNPRVALTLNRDYAQQLGVTAESIENTLYYAFGSRQISNIYTPNNNYQVILELLPEFQTGPSSLSYVYLRSNGGDLVPLSSVASFKEDIGPLSVNHLGQLPSVTLSFNLQPGRALSEAVDEINTVARKVLPEGVSTSFQGTAQAFQSSISSTTWLLVIAIVFIYMVLAILYESFIHPLTILTSLPVAGVGALLTLLIFGFELSVYGFVGVIMLIGVVKKNGIMMVDFAVEAQRDQKKSAEDAIIEASLVRFRPIMMTTMAALLGTLPLAVGYGAGAESRQPLGLAVVGGLLFSQFLTLYITPVFYVYMDRFSQRVAQRLPASWRE